MDKLSDREKELIQMYRQLEPEDRGEVRGIMRAFYLSYKKESLLDLIFSKLKAMSFLWISPQMATPLTVHR